MLSSTAPRVLRGLLPKAARSLASFPPHIQNAPATQITTLENGLRVASEGSAAFGQTATVGVWIDAGSRYETDANNGVAHFLEHMIFKGTRTRTQRDLEVEIESMGGHLNAYTSREQTVYYAKVFKDDVPKAMEILSDIITCATLDEDAITRERDVILREMEEVNKQHEEVIFDDLHATAFQGTGLGRTILGPAENIRTITKHDLQEYIATHYTAPRVVVAGAGAVDHEEFAALAARTFGGLPAEPLHGLVVPDDPVRFTGSAHVHRDDSQPLAHVALAFEGAGWTSPHAFPLMVMQTLLGSWDRVQGGLGGSNASSNLVSALAEGKLAHSVASFNTCYKDTGLFGVYAVGEPHNLNQMMWHTLDSIVRLCHHTTDAEVERARAQLKASVVSGLDGTSAVCEDIGRQLLTYGRRMSPAEAFMRIDAVTAEEVKNTAVEFIHDNEIALAAFGPVHELPDYNWIRRRTFWQRY